MGQYEKSLKRLEQAERDCCAAMLSDLYDDGLSTMPVTDDFGNFMSKEEQIKALKKGR